MDLNIKDFVSIGGSILTCWITIGIVKQTLKEAGNDICELKDRLSDLEKTYVVLTELSTDIKWLKDSFCDIKKQINK